MKKGYIKLMVIEFFLMAILLLNSLIINVFTGYYMILFLIAVLFIFRKIFGLEKDKHTNANETIKTVLIYLMVVLIIYYALGAITGFAYNQNYYTLNGFVVFIIPAVITSILIEFLRYQVLQKSEGNNILIVLTIIIFILIDMSNSIYYGNFKTNYDILLFIGLYMLPSIVQNICNTFISKTSGYKPVMIYMILLNLSKYLLPIVPNYSEFMTSLFNLLVPSIMLIIALGQFNDRLDIELFRNVKSKKNLITNIGLTTVILIVVYFISGYFRYMSIAIASGSMTPTFGKGSVVIVKRNPKIKDIQIGSIVAYDYEGKVIVHRINRIVEIKGQKFYYTKGDANEKEDNYKIESNKIIGIVHVAIPLIGYPTVWLNEL